MSVSEGQGKGRQELSSVRFHPSQPRKHAGVGSLHLGGAPELGREPASPPLFVLVNELALLQIPWHSSETEFSVIGRLLSLAGLDSFASLIEYLPCAGF